MTADQQRTYWHPEPIPREWVVKALASGNPDEIANALVRLTYHDPDWRYVYDCCMRFAKHEDPMVRSNAATCMGLLAVFHRDPQIKDAIPVLKEMAKDPEVASFAEDAIADIRHALRKRRAKKP